MLNLRRDSTAAQLNEVLESVRGILAAEPKIEMGKIPVRFVGISDYALNVEVAVNVMTADFDAFLGLQQKMLLEFLGAIEKAGTALAVPMQESFQRGGRD
jgi:MscS family membrane protein